MAEPAARRKYAKRNGPRAAAKQSGKTTYEGSPCPKGHGTKHRTSSGSCVVCERLRCADSQRLSIPTRPEPEYCECCGRAEENRSLAADHDHVTGKFRGWLCNSCNRGLGLLGDSAEAIARMWRYLNYADLI